jgi:Tfp pilus assembly protein FimT
MCFVASEGEVLRGQRVRSRPEVVTNALRITDGKAVRLAAYGFIDKGGKNNKLFRIWFRSVLTFPTEVARDSRLSAKAIHAFRTTQSVADALQTGLRMLRPLTEAKKTDMKRTYRTEVDSLSGFWQRLELALSSVYLDALDVGDLAAEEELWTVIRREARAAFTNATGPQRRTADGLFRIVNASNWFEARLSRLLPKPGKENRL